MEWTAIIGLITTTIGGIVGWFAGKYKRDNEAIKSLQATIDDLLIKNSEYINKISELQNRVLEMETSNKQLIAGQNELKEEVKKLTAENEKLNKAIAKKK